MPLFTSSKEKRQWLYAGLVLVAIISTHFGSNLLGPFVEKQENQAILFWIALILIGTSVFVHGIKSRSSKFEVAIWLGITAVYLLLFLRVGHPERSHLMEYSVLAIFIHKALIERLHEGNYLMKASIIAFMTTLIIGTLDECIQIFLPSRVFDPLDILFNGLAGFLAIGASLIINWVRKKFSIRD